MAHVPVVSLLTKPPIKQKQRAIKCCTFFSDFVFCRVTVEIYKKLGFKVQSVRTGRHAALVDEVALDDADVALDARAAAAVDERAAAGRDAPRDGDGHNGVDLGLRHAADVGQVALRAPLLRGQQQVGRQVSR